MSADEAMTWLLIIVVVTVNIIVLDAKSRDKKGG